MTQSFSVFRIEILDELDLVHWRPRNIIVDGEEDNLGL